MIINKSKNNFVRFDDLDITSIFEYDGQIYISADNGIGDKESCNAGPAVNMEAGLITNFNYDTLVIPYPNATLNLE